MSFLARNSNSSSRRPYWLLLVLALFVAGQVAGSAHWHEALDQADADCALCLLSSANGAAMVAEGWQLPAPPLDVLVVSLLLVAVRRTVVRFHDSRAPPSLLNLSV